MAFQLQVVKTSDFVRLDAQGRPDLERTRQVLEAVARECLTRDVNCALIDVREAQGDLTLTDLFTLVCAFQAMGFRKEHRLAVLHRYTRGEKAEFFAMCAASRGWNVRAFDEFEDAMAWFAEPLEEGNDAMNGA